MTKFSPTHVLAYEDGEGDDRRMVEVLVRRDKASLLTESEWLNSDIPDWTIEDDGRLYYCGVDFASERGQCTLRLISKKPVDLSRLHGLIVQGLRNPMEMAECLGRGIEEVETALATLERLGRVQREGPRAGPRWG